MKLSRRALMANATALSALAAGCGTTASTNAANNSDAIGNSDGVGLAARIRAGEITAGEAMEAAIARAERVNPQLNFLAEKAYELGRTQATTPSSGPFGGVPTLIKDLTDVRGLHTRNGSRAFANNIAASQPPYVDALSAGGLRFFGKSTTPEFGFTATTEPLLGGPTRNPWNTERSTGGSSGGAAAAVAARVIPVAHATDGGGSIRIPASCNGLVGLKPSRGRHVSAGRPNPGLDISVAGCVSVSVRDTAAWHAVTERTGADAAFPPVGLVTGPNTRRLRIVMSLAGARGADPDPDVRAAIENVAELCRRLGHQVRDERVPLAGDQQLTDDFVLLWATGAAQVAAFVRQQAPNAPLDHVLEPLTLQLAEHAQRAPRGALEAAIGRLRAAEPRYTQTFANADLILTPVLAKAPVPIGFLSPELPFDVGFRRVIEYAGYTGVLNIMGAPGISLPLGWSAEGLPIGAHFCAAAGDERTLLELAYELEQAQPWANRVPGVNAA